VEPARQPLSVQVMLKDDSPAESWRRVLEHLKTSTATYWLVTCGGHGTPHVATTFSSSGTGRWTRRSTNARRPRPAGPRARDLRRRLRPGVRAQWPADRASGLLRGLGIRAPAPPRVRGLAPACVRVGQGPAAALRWDLQATARRYAHDRCPDAAFHESCRVGSAAPGRAHEVTVADDYVVLDAVSQLGQSNPGADLLRSRRENAKRL
jgi:hypothetical protein